MIYYVCRSLKIIQTNLLFSQNILFQLGRELDALRLQLQEIRRERDQAKTYAENIKEENEELKELWRK